jgi:hypothetical protein
MDNILNDAFRNVKTLKWLAVQMLNEDAEIWNEEHPDNPKPLLDEKKLGRLVVGIGGVNELQKKVQEAMLKGLPEDKIQQVEKWPKNLKKNDSCAEEEDEWGGKPEINFAQLIIIGKIMNYPEREIWRMTMRKLLSLWQEYKYIFGLEKQYESPDDIIPGEDVI